MVHESLIVSGEISLFCRVTGNGPPLVMVHGACVDCDFFREASLILSKQHRVYTYDRRGYSRSSTPADCDYSIQTQAEDLAAVVAAAGSYCDIVAHSAGTVIAMEMASRHPDLVRRLILYEPPMLRYLANDTVLEQFTQILTAIHDEKYLRALARFLPFIEEQDPRLRESSDEEMLHLQHNSQIFIRHEFEQIFLYEPDPHSLASMDIQIGIGELSKDTPRWPVGQSLAKDLHCGILYYPGAHNGAMALPKEFAWITNGALREPHTKRS